MRRLEGAILLAAWVACSTPALGARVFLSPSSTNPQWQTIGQQTFVAGESARLYVWVIPDSGEVLNGLSLSLRAQGGGEVETLSQTIFEPELAGSLARWEAVTVQDPQTLDPPPPLGTPGGILNDGALLFRDWNAAALINDTPIPGFTSNVGLAAGNAAQDPLYHAASGAYLHSQLEVLGTAVGELELFLQVGNRGVSAHSQGFATLFFGNSQTPIDGGSAGASDPSADSFLRIVGLAGDTDGDWQVGLSDLNNVRNNFGSPGLGDTDGDGMVQLSDLNQVRNQFGAVAVMPASASRLFAVPEPEGRFLAGFGVVGIFGFFGWRGHSDLLESDRWGGRADCFHVFAKEDRPLMN